MNDNKKVTVEAVTERKKDMLYISHPFLTNGNADDNKKAVDKILADLVLKYGKDYVFISPIHNYGTLDGQLNYDQGLSLCLDLLRKCDGIIMCGDYFRSNGCKMELMNAIGWRKEIYKLEEFL